MPNTGNSILVVGATGYTGGLVVEYLSKHPERSTFQLQIGGRSKDKLRRLSETHQLDPTVALVVFDVLNEEEVATAVSQCTVVINCAGPYYSNGSNIVGACARLGRHYADLTAEAHWIKAMIDKYDDVARETGAIIIPATGFDSIGGDLGPFLSYTALRKLTGNPNVRLGKSMTAHTPPEQLSGGTLASLYTMFDEVPKKEILDVVNDPYILAPKEVQGTGKIPQGARLWYELPFLKGSDAVGGAFFPLATCNEANVRRTWGLMKRFAEEQGESKGPQYGPDFEYEEFMIVPGRITATLLSAMILTTGIIMLFVSPIRKLAGLFFPASGTGPSREFLETASYYQINVTSSVADPVTGEPARHVKSKASGRGDMAYLLTSNLISEVALSLLPANHDKLTEVGKKGGLLTTMSAVGETLVKRLDKTGRWTFEYEEVFEDGASSKKLD